MRIASVSEDQKIEKRIAVTPGVAKKYLNLGFEIFLPENSSMIRVQNITNSMDIFSLPPFEIFPKYLQ